MQLVVRSDYTELKSFTPRVRQLLSDSLRYLDIAGATSYNPRFSSGKWDGYVNLFDPYQCRFPTGLLARVRGIFKREGLDFEVVRDLPKKAVSTPFSMACNSVLRPYQQDAVNAIATNFRGIVRVPTGGGKTLVAQNAIFDTQSPRAIFLCPSRAILNQTHRRFQRAFPDLPIIKWGDGAIPMKDVPERYILCATVQSAWKISHGLLEESSMLVIDECQHQAAETFQQATRTCNKANYVIGLSATPYRDDGADMELEAWIGPVIYEIGYKELIQMGYLVPPKFKAVHSLEEAILATKDRKTLLFSEKVQDLESMRSIYEKHNVTILTGKDSTKKIERALHDLDKGIISHIAATPIFDEGLDVPSINAVVFANAGRGRVRTIQRIGRGLRPAPGKKDCLVVDIRDANYLDRKAHYLKEPAFAALV